MISVNRMAATNIVEMEIDGGVTAAEFDDILAQLNEAIKQHGTIRVLEIVHSIDEHGTIRLLKYVRSIQFPPIPMSRLWDDLKFAHEHLGDITHIAGVTDIPGTDAIVGLMNPMFKAELKHFKSSELEAAREWLRNAQPVQESISKGATDA